MAANDITNMKVKHAGNTVSGDWIAVAPSNTVSLGTTPRAVKVEGAGTIVLGSLNGNVIHFTFTGTDPHIIPCAPDKILVSGNDALGNAHTTDYTLIYVMY